jgi:hypothetical protein
MEGLAGNGVNTSNMEASYLNEFWKEFDEDSTPTYTLALVDEELDTCIAEGEQSATPKKRRSSKGKTPIVDDEVRRSSRFKKNIKVSHIQLNAEPRRKNGQSKKTEHFHCGRPEKGSYQCGNPRK